MAKNKDGFEAGASVSDEDLQEYFAKQRQAAKAEREAPKVEKPKRGRPPKDD